MNPEIFNPIRVRPLAALLLILLFLALPCMADTVPADTTEYPEDVAKRLQENYDRMTSLTFSFHQDTRGETVGRARKGSGTAAFLKKKDLSKMRWDYTSPSRQVLLSDGKHFYMYFAELGQMIVSPAKSLENDLTYSFFSGKGNLVKDFHIRPADAEFNSESGSGLTTIKLIPIIPHSQVQDIHVWVTADSLIRRIQLRDHFGTITMLNLNDISVDGLAGKSQKELDALFSFTPPEGTEIIEQ